MRIHKWLRGGLPTLCLMSLVSAASNSTQTTPATSTTSTTATTATSSTDITSAFYSSPKRGLIFIPNANFPDDNAVWVQNGSDLTWYYNYKAYPSTEYAEDTAFQFVPMLWGAPSSFNDTTFIDNVTAQIVHGSNITHVMGFNEPDGTSATGGSDIAPSDAALYWIKQMEPLRKLGVLLGAPAVTGALSGFQWLANFTDACDGGCTFDFIPIHWYGNLLGLQNHLADVAAAYPGVDQWITEFALDDAALNTTQEFFQDAVRFLDENDNVTNYSYFGSFRSFTSNVGINVAMLDSWGNLTDIGSWYLGGNATGIIPTNTSVTPAVVVPTGGTATYTLPPLATKVSAGPRQWAAGREAGLAALVAVVFLLL
ncbi:hypothetical protein SCUCBS95973_006017 [Sporothrix curviconia]|uniref:Asl1-like glycosyl hydrolase catalytic domain-containing protein n=1 Tax=Sporothrix curviconia TaxID=1260050 RepID=A0ABP0C223_9PEZI